MGIKTFGCVLCTSDWLGKQALLIAGAGSSRHSHSCCNWQWVGLWSVWCTTAVHCYDPAQRALSDDALWRLSRTSGQWAGVWPAGWIAHIGWSGPAWPAWLKAAAVRFHCRPGQRHIVVTACLQLVKFKRAVLYNNDLLSVCYGRS